jgi:hypothetical protein
MRLASRIPTSYCRQLTTVLSAALLALVLLPAAVAQNNSQPSTLDQPANALDQLLSGQGRKLISQPVTLSHVAIQGMTQDDILWVGPNAGRRVLVMLQPSVSPIDAQGNPTPVAAGDIVRVTGHVIPAPSAQQLQSWGVPPTDAARVQHDGVIIQATTVEITQRQK